MLTCVARVSFWIVSGRSLRDLKKSCAALQVKSVAPATMRARRTQINCYYRFCERFGLEKYPCLDFQLALYVTHLSKFMVFTSISNYIQGVLFFHKLKGWHPPSASSSQVKMTLQGVKRVKPGGVRPRDPITFKLLSRIYSVLDCELLGHHMFWACSLLLFRTLLRVSHVTESPHTLLAGDVKLSDKGMLICVQTSKSKQHKGTPHVIPVACISNRKLCAVCWLRSWLLRRKPLPHEPVFSFKNSKPLSYNLFQTCLNNVLTKAGKRKNFVPLF